MADRLKELFTRIDTPKEQALDRATAELTKFTDEKLNPSRATYREGGRTGDRLYAALEIAPTGAGLQSSSPAPTPKEPVRDEPELRKPTHFKHILTPGGYKPFPVVATPDKEQDRLEAIFSTPSGKGGLEDGGAGGGHTRTPGRDSDRDK